ncbi:MAG: hypothetical protein GX628_08695 [Clostridiales bacterium]|nr:hypothetical protein [Clostridiales bacterium]
MIKRTLSGILTFIIICLPLLTLQGCGGSGNTGSADTTAITAAETEFDPYYGLERKDFNGKTFTMLTRAACENVIYVEEDSGDALNDAVKSRNRAVEERYNITIKSVPKPNEWEQRNEFLATITSSVLAGDGAFDIVQGYAATIGAGFEAGIYLNLNEIDSLRLDQPWWSEIIRDELTVNGILYAITGDIAYDLWANTHVIYFNKVLSDSYKLESPYEAVTSGKWVYDLYLSMLTGLYSDVNGDSKSGEEDSFGAVYYDSLSFDNFHNAFGVPYTRHNDDGSVSLDNYNEKIIAISEKVYDLALNNTDIYFTNGDVLSTRDTALNIFMGGRGLFLHTTLTYSSRLRAMDDDFGILPYPKGDEAQERYYTASRDGRSMFTIPIDVADPEFSGFIAEALCTLSRSEVIPVYHDIVLKGKTARDEDSQVMLDIIREGIILDFAAEYAVQTERAGFIIRDCIQGKQEIASFYAANKTKQETAFAKFLEAYKI